MGQLAGGRLLQGSPRLQAPAGNPHSPADDRDRCHAHQSEDRRKQGDADEHRRRGDNRGDEGRIHVREDFTQNHELARDEARRLSGRVRAEGPERQGRHLVADRSVHVRQEVEGHRIGAHGEQVLDDKGGKGAQSEHNEPRSQAHTPRGRARGQGNRSRDEGDQGDAAHRSHDTGQHGCLNEVGSSMLGEGFAQPGDEVEHVSVLSRARSCDACRDDRRAGRACPAR